ncbi:SRPBCC family protein [Limobrevibacterium gyesilva]|uniref:Polyketide cyclase n=1 Tax=Limobrevibacterium gyesilva TaxID=2991712 RepID=A0AA42CHT9_9PROT|nr:SRPBCC family protein [Limobrevibacterium gyesilva]MCW3475220.1 polyketide cyclase [Limobrevibacterium gyesilva]
MPVQPALTLGIGIARPLAEVYAFLAEPGNFAKWASGLGHSFHRIGDGEWRAETPMGPMTIRFTAPNPYGVLDHDVIPETGGAMHNPMRVVANGDGSEVVFTLFQRPGVSDAAFARDADWVRRDLLALKTLLES